MNISRRFAAIAGVAAACALPAVSQAQTFNYFTTGQFSSTVGSCNNAAAAASVTCSGAGLSLMFNGSSTGGPYIAPTFVNLGKFTPGGEGTITLPPPNVMFTLFLNQTSPTTGMSNVIGSLAGMFTQGPGGNQSTLEWTPNNTTLTVDPVNYALILDQSGGVNIAASLPTDVKAYATVPEPSSMALLGTGLFGLVPMIRRKRQK